MRIAYSKSQIAEAVALSTVVGADAAAAQLGMTARAIRGWAERAGKSPSDAIDTDAWRSLMDFALARVTAQVASGKMRPRDMAVVAGIAARNVREPAARPEPATDVETFMDGIEANLHRVLDDPDQEEIAIVALLDWWNAGDPAAPASSTAASLQYIDSLGDLDAWWTRRLAVVIANREKAEAAQRAIEQARGRPSSRRLVSFPMVTGCAGSGNRMTAHGQRVSDVDLPTEGRHGLRHSANSGGVS